MKPSSLQLPFPYQTEIFLWLRGYASRVDRCVFKAGLFGIARGWRHPEATCYQTTFSHTEVNAAQSRKPCPFLIRRSQLRKRCSGRAPEIDEAGAQLKRGLDFVGLTREACGVRASGGRP